MQLTCKHICSCCAGPSRYIRYTCLSPAVMSPMLVPYQWAGNHSCTRQSNKHVTVAPDQQPCLYKLHTIIHVCSSFILSASMDPTISHVCNSCIRPFAMYLTVAPNQQSCLCLLNVHIQACMSDTLAQGQHSYLL